MSALDRKHVRLVRRSESGRALLFALATLPLGAGAMAVLITGWTVALSVSFTPLVIPTLIGFAWTVRTACNVEAALARRLIDAPVGPSAPPPAVRGYWRQGWRVLTDKAFWRRQVYLLSRFTVGWVLAIAELSLLAGSAWLIGSPLYYRWIHNGDGDGINLGIWHADTFHKTLPLAAVGVLGLMASLALLRPLAALWRRIAVELLPPNMNDIAPTPTSPAARQRALTIHASVVATVGALLIVIWAATTRGYFWPLWPILPLALTVAIHWWVSFVVARPGLWSRRHLTPALAVHLGTSAAVELFLVGVWAASGRGYFWPFWTLLGLAVPALIHRLTLLSRRVETLEQRRTGAVQVQETDRRRIERDLHDGAQARLVALGMNLGLAEQKFDSDPDAARALVTEARQGVGETLRELRDLVRGIRPPVLADRGLGAAIAALADRSPLVVEVTADVEPRPTDAVETAAYFVVAESLANAAKHAEASRVDVRLQRHATMLLVEVTDDGHGGADPAGSGLTGLRQRVEALDGTFTISSRSGGPTIVRAELPCAP